DRARRRAAPDPHGPRRRLRPARGVTSRLRLTLLYSALLALTLLAFGGVLYLTVERVARGVVRGTLEDEADRLLDGRVALRVGGRELGAIQVARSLAEAQGGVLAVESRAGEGTTVRLRLPRPTLEAARPWSVAPS